jgi:sugar phosphate isomerase/epimerase
MCAEAKIGAVNFATGRAMETATAPEDDWWELPPTRPDPASWDTLIKSLEQLCSVAEKEGVDLALETVIGNLLSELGTTLELSERFDHPRLKLTFDPSHYVLAGQDLAMVIQRLGTRIRHVHFKDAAGRVGSMGKDFLFPFLGEGNTDWQSFFGGLRAIGYDGVLSIEFESFRYMNIILEGNAAEAAKISRFAADKLIKRYGS